MINTLLRQLKVNSFKKSFLGNKFKQAFSKKQNKQEYRFENDTYILEEMFKPSEKLNFINGYLPLYRYTFYKTGRSTMIFLIGLTSVVCYYSANKLLHIQDRGIIGVIFYSMIFLFTAPKIPRFYKILHHMAIQIDLKEGGKVVRVTLPKLVALQGFKEYDIAQVSYPTPVNSKMMGTSLFPVKFDKDILFISKDGQILNKEVLQVVFKSQYINTQDE